MTVEELIEWLQLRLNNGSLTEDGALKMRNTSVSQEAMDAGSDGYTDVMELLIVEGDMYILPGEEEMI